MRHWFHALSFLAALFLPNDGIACTAEKMKTTDNGFIFKIVGGSDLVEAKESPGSDKTAFVLDLLAPYFVICEEDQFYKITDLQAETVKQAETGKVGYVLKDHVHPWPTREALNFSAVAFTGERSEIVAWDDMSALEKFLETGNMKLGPPAFKENLESTLKRERATRPYPVLSSEMKQLRKSVDKRVFDVLLPAALPPEAKLVISTAAQGKENVIKKVESALTNATFVIAFDATGSMEKFAKQAAREMEAAFDGLPPQVVSGCKLGFVFFRDQDDDEKYAIVKPLPIPDAIKLLKDAATPAYMKGGGDPPEPVLDAVYIAHHLYPWGSDSNQTAGRKIIVAVLNDDAKPLTTGKIHDGVPPGIEPAKIAADLLTDQIPVISVQVGPGVGSHLVEVLSTLGEGTKGTFIDWGSGDLDERGKKVSAALSAQLKTKARGDEIRR